MTGEAPRAGHLILVGLPGAGKSTIGRLAASKLGIPFLDFDQEISRRSGLSIADHFARHGEAAFRAAEVSLTRELQGASPRVLAPGGGWITNPEVVDLLRPPGRLLHLAISAEGAWQRLSTSRVARPLLQGEDPLARLRALEATRGALYARADWIIDVENVDRQALVKKVVSLARNGGSGVG